MELHILGTAGYHPSETRHTSCVMLPELGIVFDAGTAFFRVRDLLRTKSINIFLSHAHLDHVVGLTYLLDVVHEKEIETVRVFGEEEKLASVRQHLFHPDLFPVEPPFESHVLTGSVELPSARVTYKPLQHPGGSVGYRLDLADRSMAYITDTTANPENDYGDFIENVDLLLHECNFHDGLEELAKLTGHSCSSSVAHVAKQSNVGKLVIIHQNPLYADNASVEIETMRSIFQNTVVAHDRMVVEF